MGRGNRLRPGFPGLGNAALSPGQERKRVRRLERAAGLTGALRPPAPARTAIRAKSEAPDYPVVTKKSLGTDCPPRLFPDAPASAEDPTTLGYIRTCQGKRHGDPINPLYTDRITAGAVISEAIDAYGAGHYTTAQGLYQMALASPAGKQLRVYRGLYLTNWKLGRPDAAAQAFGQIVDQGLETKRLGVKSLFKPGVAWFSADPVASGAPCEMWLKEIPGQAGKRQSCLDVVGYSGATGPAALNDLLSQLRAEQVKGQLERNSPSLTPRLIAHDVSSRETMVGNRRDDASDALDRRVEFKAIGC